MIDPVNPQNEVIVVVVMTEKEVILVYISSPMEEHV